MLWLDKNENLDPVLARLLREVLTELPVHALNSYPEAGELYRKLANWVGVTPESLVLTPGSDGAIRATFETFVEPGDSVIHTEPTFAMYPVYGQIFGAQAHPISYQPGDDSPRLDCAAILEAVHRLQPKLLCLPNPDSPTGTIIAPEVLATILEECEKAGTVLLVDEAYHPFYSWSAVPWTKRSRNIVVARTFAKAWGAAGLRIGYAVAHSETIDHLHKIRPMYEVSTIAVEFMSRLLDRVADVEKAVERIKFGKSYFCAEMRACGFKVLPTEGNFMHVAFGEAEPTIKAALASKVFYRSATNHPSLNGFSRFTVAPVEIMENVANLIKEAIGKE
jgi:histidinol-phosphate aminotransferase